MAPHERYQRSAADIRSRPQHRHHVESDAAKLTSIVHLTDMWTRLILIVSMTVVLLVMGRCGGAEPAPHQDPPTTSTPVRVGG